MIPAPEDNARPEDLSPEPVGFWGPVHRQVVSWLEGQEDDGDTD